MVIDATARQRRGDEPDRRGGGKAGKTLLPPAPRSPKYFGVERRCSDKRTKEPGPETGRDKKQQGAHAGGRSPEAPSPRLQWAYQTQFDRPNNAAELTEDHGIAQ